MKNSKDTEVVALNQLRLLLCASCDIVLHSLTF